jgi:hypothetical protein
METGRSAAAPDSSRAPSSSPSGPGNPVLSGDGPVLAHSPSDQNPGGRRTVNMHVDPRKQCRLPALAVEGLCVARGGRSVLRQVSMRLARGAVTALVGPSGGPGPRARRLDRRDQRRARGVRRPGRELRARGRGARICVAGSGRKGVDIVSKRRIRIVALVLSLLGLAATRAAFSEERPSKRSRRSARRTGRASSASSRPACRKCRARTRRARCRNFADDEPSRKTQCAPHRCWLRGSMVAQVRYRRSPRGDAARLTLDLACLRPLAPRPDHRRLLRRTTA